MSVGTVMPLQTISHYDLLEKIAEGGMGTVYRGRDVDTDKIEKESRHECCFASVR